MTEEITKQDVQKLLDENNEKLTEGLVTKLSDAFITKIDFENFRDEYKKDFSNLLTAVDKYAKRADDYFAEMVSLARKVDRHEKWLLQIAEKLGLKLEY
jgi:uncharacterized coiled-coil DUF342 family protein